jgi:hypothetical protein
MQGKREEKREGGDSQGSLIVCTIWRVYDIVLVNMLRMFLPLFLSTLWLHERTLGLSPPDFRQAFQNFSKLAFGTEHTQHTPEHTRSAQDLEGRIDMEGDEEDQFQQQPPSSEGDEEEEEVMDVEAENESEDLQEDEDADEDESAMAAEEGAEDEDNGNEDAFEEAADDLAEDDEDEDGDEDDEDDDVDLGFLPGIPSVDTEAPVLREVMLKISNLVEEEVTGKEEITATLNSYEPPRLQRFSILITDYFCN